MLNQRPYAFLSGLLLIAASTLAGAPAALGQAPADQTNVALPPQTLDASGKLHPALLNRLDQEPGPAKAWVFFVDKGVDSPQELKAALAEVAESYNQRAKLRRMLRGSPEKRAGHPFDEHDLPVVQQYIDAVTAAGAQLHVTSRWLNAISVRATRAQCEALAALPFVDRLEAVGRSRGLRPLEQQDVGDGPFPGHPERNRVDYGASFNQLDQIRVVDLHDAGYTGAGVIIGILDTGFRRTHTAFNQPGHVVDVVAEWDFVDNDADAGMEAGDPSSQHEHGTLILGCIGAYMPTALVGGAYDASFVLCKTEDVTGEYPAEEDNYVAGLEFIELNGADMSTASLGYIDWYTQADLDGQTAVTTIAVNQLTANGVHHCNAAGNEYHDSNPSTSSLIAPADGFQVITCGAVDSGGTIAYFSSEGPTADGRVKPELLARGDSTHTVSPSYNSSYTTASGTSLSTPLVACAVACLVQAHPEWTVDEMREALFYTADDYVANGTYDPLYVRGYGLVNAYAPLEDCNENGVPDVVELANGTGYDCQNNGVLDECDIADGTSEDCNDNDVPDECDIALPAPTLVNSADALLGWMEISGSGTALNLSDDGEATAVMPFTNSLFYTGVVHVGNNGAIGFGGASELPYENGAIPSTAAFGGALALFPLWDDIDADTGNVYYETLGTAPQRTFVVEWHDRPHFSGDTVLDGDEVTFQVQVFETPTDSIFAQFLYLDTDFDNASYDNGASATVGYQESGSVGIQWSYNQPVITPSTVISLQSQDEPTSQDENGNGIPDECETSIGDLNCDGAVDFGDVNPFVLALSDPAGYEATYPDCNRMNADCNEDGEVDFGDVNPFVTLVSGP